MKKNIKRVIAGVLSVVLTLGLVNLSALSMSLAGELSGYEIGVEYASDNTSATLTGNTFGVREGVQLDKLVDSDGQELDPTDFSQTVEENGTYHFTLHYLETVAAQDGTEETTEEKTQELEVVVDGIVKPESQETPAVDAETVQEETPKETLALPTGSAMTAGGVVPLDVLQKNMAATQADGTEPTKSVDIYADEVEYKLNSDPIEFSGGELVAGAEGLPAVTGRAFKYAVYVRQGVLFPISGLYSFSYTEQNQTKVKWYYTLQGNGSLDTDAGEIRVGFELPSDASIRLYYEVVDTSSYPLTINKGNGDLGTDYQLTVNGGNTYNKNYLAGSKIIMEFVMPSKFSSATINIPQISFSGNIGNATESTELVENKIVKITEFRYALLFTMPSKATTVSFSGTEWTNQAVFNFGLGSEIVAPYSGEGATDSHFKSTVGALVNAQLTHYNNFPTYNQGAMQYTPRQENIKYHKQSGEVASMGVAAGSYRAGNALEFSLKMDRNLRNTWYPEKEFTWKPTLLKVLVYIGKDQAFAGENFHEYYIPLAKSTAANEKSIETRLDCGAVITTTCVSLENKSYQYTIRVEGMIHNFVMYDCPASTIQENFLVTQLDGIKVHSGKEAVTDASYVDYRIDQGANHEKRPLRTYNKYLWSERNTDTNTIDFYVEPMDGYTAPTKYLDRASETSGASLTLDGYDKATGQYHYVLRGSGAKDDVDQPASISFTSQPLTFDVRYYYGGKQYDTGDTVMSISQNSYYAIEQKSPTGMSNVKGYILKLYDFNDNELAVINKSDIDSSSSSQYWYPNQDIISYKEIYDWLKKENKLPSTAACMLRIVPEGGSGTEGIVLAKYTVRYQTGITTVDNNLSATGLTDDNSRKADGKIYAYLGSTVNLFGYREQFGGEETGGKQYLLNPKKSSLSGKVESANQEFASLEYYLATQVTVDQATLGDGNNYATWITTDTGVEFSTKWYTSVNNFNHVIKWTNLDPGDKKDGEVFDGWEIRGKSGQSIALGDATSLNLYTKLAADANNKTLWSDIFETGTCTLVATWRSNIQEVKSADGVTPTNSNNEMIQIIEGTTKSFTVSGDFYYGDGTIRASELTTMLDNKELKVALVKKDGDAGKTWSVRYFNQTNTTSVPKPNIEDVAGNNFKVTFSITNNVTGFYNIGANFRILVWTSANNGGDDIVTNRDIENKLNGTTTNPFEGNIPSVNTQTTVIYKVKSSGGVSITNEDATAVEIQQKDRAENEFFTLTADFRYGDGTTRVSPNELEKLYKNGTLKIMLFKQNAEGSGNTDWAVRTINTEEANNPDAIGPVFSEGLNGNFRITFTIKKNAVSAWNNGANFRIFAWTKANDGADSMTASNIATALNGAGTTNPYDTKVPSVNTVTTVLYRVTNGGDTTFINVPVTKKVNEGESFTLEGQFRYGAGDATLSDKKVDALYKSGKLKIVLVKKNPNATTWSVYDAAGDPVITADVSDGDYMITFTVSADTGSDMSPEVNDGASFRIYAWTDANPIDPPFTSDNPGQEIVTTLSGGGTYVGQIPSAQVDVTLIYPITDNSAPTSSLTVLSTDNSINLNSIVFKYNYDTTRYPDPPGYNGGPILSLLTDENITTVKLEYQKKGSTDWVEVNGVTVKDVFDMKEAAKGLFKFSSTYNLSKNEDMGSFDGAKFKISVETTANTAPAEHVVTVNVISPVTLSNGNISDVPLGTERLNVKDTNSFTVSTTFKYGNQTLTQQEVETLIADNTIKLVLAKKRPPKGTTLNEWVLWYSDNQSQGFNVKRSVTVGKDGLFTVTFTISNNNGNVGRLEDGAIYRIFAWSDANGTNVSSLNGTTLVEKLNEYKTDSKYNPYPDELPSAAKTFTMLYEMALSGGDTSTMSVLDTSKDISLSVDFKYDYDTERYPKTSGYDGAKLRDLIDAGDITVELQYKKKDEPNWTSMNITSKNALKPQDAKNGIIRFTYTYTPNEALSTFDGAQFKVIVRSLANAAPVEHIVTVAYVYDASDYVTIPKYIILEDDKSNVMEDGILQDGYAGKSAQVSYDAAGATLKPSITVKVQDGVMLHKDSIDGEEMQDMAIGIYDKSGGKIPAISGYSTIGILDSNNPSLTFWMNVKRGTVKNQQYYATVMFTMETSGTIT